MRDEYLLMVNEFVEKYEDYKKEVIEYYQEHKDTVSVEDLESYYPSLENIKKKFYFDIVSFEIALPAEFGQLNLQDEIHREQTNNEAKRQALDNYKQEYAKQIELHTAKLSSFMTDVTSTLRGQVAEHFTVVLNKVNKKEVVSPASIQAIYKQIEEFRAANIVDDKIVEQELSKLEKLLDGNPNFNEDRDAVGLLKQHLGNVVNAAKDISDIADVSGEYFRKISL